MSVISAKTCLIKFSRWKLPRTTCTSPH